MNKIIAIIVVLLIAQKTYSFDRFFLIKAVPLKDIYVNGDCNTKAIPAFLMQLNNDSLIIIDTLSSNYANVLDIQANYNKGVFAIVKDSIESNNIYDSRRFDLILKRKDVIITPFGQSDISSISRVININNTSYLSIITHDDSMKSINLSTLKDTIIKYDGTGEYQLSGSAYGVYTANRKCRCGIEESIKWVPDSLRSSLTFHIIDQYQIVIELDKKTEPDHTIFTVYNKLNKRWVHFSVLGKSSTINAFGTWLVGNIYYSDKEMGGHVDSPGREIRDSIWNNDWYSPTERYQYPDYPDYKCRWGAGYTAEDRFRDMQIYSPGIMYLFNTQTGDYLEIITEQGDSQILLVEDEQIYYRVNNEIYVANIVEGNQVGKPKLLVKDRNVVDIHWAFTIKE